MPPPAAHFVNRAGWLRAAVLGANDGIISIASLIVGVASAGALRGEILTAAVAGWAAGAMAMAAGEYVSVSSLADLETADLVREQHALEHFPEIETDELTVIYERRGLASALARQVAEQLMATDALSAHARDELGLSDARSANPILAAFASAISFSAGAAMPTLAAFLASREATAPAVFSRRPGVARCARRVRRLDGRRANCQAGAARGVLGGAGDGGDGGDRRADRRGGLGAGSPPRSWT